jgi:outer membrane autotransporter protein
VVWAGLALLAGGGPAGAQTTFNEALDAQLDGATTGGGAFEPCVRLVGGDRDPVTGAPIGFGPQLTQICTTIPPGAGAASASSQASSGGGVAPETPVERRLRALRGDEEEAGGAQAAARLDSGVSVFFSADFGDRDREQTAFEDGYGSDLWAVTAGADYPFSESVVGGLAFNYTSWNGDYDTGGGFESNAYGLIGYASIRPADRFFVDAMLGYAWKDFSEDRRRFYTREIVNAGLVPGQAETQVFGGRVDSDRDDGVFSGRVLVGYDHPLQGFTVGPRLALDFAYTDMDGYSEKGTTGLELKYASDSRTSVKSRLGLYGSSAISTGFGVVVPHASADWVHEFADDRRAVSAQFVQDLRSNPTRFSFDTDKPDRNAYELAAGAVLVLPHGVQAFANVRWLTGDEYYDSVVGVLGVRIDM